MKSLPPEGTEEFKQLINWEVEKISGGITVNGVYFSGWLYWHLNHWWIRVDATDEWGNDIRKPALPDLRDNEWIRAEFLEQCKRERKGYIEVGARQGGKALLDTSLLYKEEGEIYIGECKIGDRIYDEQGKLTTIVAKYPQGIRPVYRVTMIDGRQVYCDIDHKWYVKDRFARKSREVIKTTQELLKDYKRKRQSWKHRINEFEYRYSVPNNKPVEYSHRDLPVDPYFLGLWLGDGSNTYSKITTVDDEIAEYIRKYADSVGLQVTMDGDDTLMVTTGVMGGNKEEKKERNFIHQYIKSLYNNKHIPYEYMYASIEQRMELLRGLMDTDGSCDKTGSIEFSSSIPRLAEDFYKLCRSLGIVLTKKTKKTSYRKGDVSILCKDSFRFTLFTDKPIFRLKRKLDNIRCKPKYGDWVTITGIEYIGEDRTTCIVVDNESHLFLTDNYTPTHNSEMEASYFGMNSTLFSNTQNLIICGNDNDLSLLKDKVDFGLRHLWKGISIPRLDKTWRLNQIRLGYKTVDGEDEIWSYIIIRNARDGNVTEVAAGATAKTFIMDEVGKYPFAEAFKAGEPTIKGRSGWRTVPILVGTGGSFDNGKNAEDFFYNPAANNFMGLKDDETNMETGLFLSGLYRLDCKYETTLAEWLLKEKGLVIKDDRELRKIKMWVSDKELAKKVIEKEREAAKNNPERAIYLKQIMYYPLTVRECFLSSSENIFDIEAAKRQQIRISQQERTGTPVVLYSDETGNTKHEFTDMLPISHFPLRTGDSKDAPVVIYEFPVENPPYGLYVAGVDPYRQGKAQYSSSLGAVYIYKRMHDISGEKYQDMFVASYVARPDKKERWEEQARLLIKYYNARTLCENDDISFIEYMKAKGDERYLEKQPEWLREIVPNTTVSREYGIHRSAEKVRDYLHSCLKKYMEEVVYEERDEEGNITRQVLGVYKIFDTLLLEEIIKYNEDDNFDRVVAAELAIAQAMRMDPIFGKVRGSEDPRVKALYIKKPKSTLLVRSRPAMTGRSLKLFPR